MIIARAPLRVSFLGGGTDYPEYFTEHEGEVIGTAIDKFSYITVTKLRELFEHTIRVSYSKTELVREAGDVQHPAVRECLRLLGINKNVEITVVADLPARTGLGSSASFTVCLLHALHAFKGQYVTADQLGYQAVEIERDKLHDNVGYQDQFFAALGGFQHITFTANKEVKHQPIIMSLDRQHAFNENLMMFYTGLTRSASEVAKSQVERTAVNVPYLNQMKALVREGHTVLQSGRPLEEFGNLLHEGWMLKRSLSDKISNTSIDELYAVARKAGATGGKLLGAGGGGFLLFYVEPEHQEAVRKALPTLKEVPFKFERAGSQIIYHRIDS